MYIVSPNLSVMFEPLSQKTSAKNQPLKRSVDVGNKAISRKAVLPFQKKDTENTGLGAAQTETGQQIPARLNTENKTGLPDNLKSGIEQLSGFSMDDVSVTYNSDKPAQLQALAYAQGSNIHIAPGQEKHLSHEAWHVVQQKQKRVKPTLQMKEGLQLNDNTGLEQEATQMGAKAEGFHGTLNNVILRKADTTNLSPIQLYKVEAFGAHYNNPRAFINLHYTNGGLAPKIIEDGGSGGAFADGASTHGRDVIQHFVNNTAGILEAAATYLRTKANASEYDIARADEANRLAYKTQRTADEVLDWYRRSSLPLSEWNHERFLTEHAAGAAGGQVVKYHYDRGKSVVTDAAFSVNERAVLNGPGGTGYVNGHQTINNMHHRFINHIHINKGEGDEESIVYQSDPALVDTWGAEAYSHGVTKRQRVITLSGANTDRLNTFDQGEQQARDTAAVVAVPTHNAVAAGLPAALLTWAGNERGAVVGRLNSINVSHVTDLIGVNPDELNIYRLLKEWLDGVMNMVWTERADELEDARHFNNFIYYSTKYLNSLQAGNDYLGPERKDDQYESFYEFIKATAREDWLERETADKDQIDITEDDYKAR